MHELVEFCKVQNENMGCFALLLQNAPYISELYKIYSLFLVSLCLLNVPAC